MSFGVKVDGLDGLRKTLRQVGEKDLQKQLAATNKSAAQIVVDDALPHVPVRTGALRASARALGSQKSGRAMAGTARAPHAAALHFGRQVGNVGRPPGNHPGPNPITGRMFLWDAAKRQEAKVAEEYAKDIDRLFDAVRNLTA